MNIRQPMLNLLAAFRVNLNIWFKARAVSAGALKLGAPKVFDNVL